MNRNKSRSRSTKRRPTAQSRVHSTRSTSSLSSLSIKSSKLSNSLSHPSSSHKIKFQTSGRDNQTIIQSPSSLSSSVQQRRQFSTSSSTSSSSIPTPPFPPTINENLLNAKPSSLRQTPIIRPTDRLRTLIQVILPDDQTIDDYTYLRMKKMTLQNPDLLTMSTTKLQSRFQELSKIVLHPSFYQEYTQRYVFVGGNKPTREIGIHPPKYSTLSQEVLQIMDDFKVLSAQIRGIEDEIMIKNNEIEKLRQTLHGTGNDSGGGDQQQKKNKSLSSDSSNTNPDDLFKGIGDDISTLQLNLSKLRKQLQSQQEQYNNALDVKKQYDKIHQKPYHPVVLSILDRHPTILRRKNLQLIPPKIIELFTLNGFDLTEDFVTTSKHFTPTMSQSDELSTTRITHKNNNTNNDSDDDGDNSVDAKGADISTSRHPKNPKHLDDVLIEDADTRIGDKYERFKPAHSTSPAVDPYMILGRYPALLTLDIENRLQQKVQSLIEFLGGDKELVMRLIISQPDILHSNIDAIVPKRLSFLANSCLLTPNEAIEFVRYFPRVLSPSITNSQLQRLTTFRLRPPQFHTITNDQIIALGPESSFAKDMINKLTSFIDDQVMTTDDDDATTSRDQLTTGGSGRSSSNYDQIDDKLTKCWAESFIDPEVYDLSSSSSSSGAEHQRRLVHRYDSPLINPNVSLLLNNRYLAMKYVLLMHNKTFSLLFSEYVQARKRFLLGSNSGRLVKSEEIIPHYDRLVSRQQQQGDNDDDSGINLHHISHDIMASKKQQKKGEESLRKQDFQADLNRNRSLKTYLTQGGQTIGSSVGSNDDGFQEDFSTTSHKAMRMHPTKFGHDSDLDEIIIDEYDYDTSDFSDGYKTTRKFNRYGSDAELDYTSPLALDDNDNDDANRHHRNPSRDNIRSTRTFKAMPVDDRYDDGINDGNRRILQRDRARDRRHRARGQYRLVEENISEKDYNRDEYSNKKITRAIEHNNQGKMYDKLKISYGEPSSSRESGGSGSYSGDESGRAHTSMRQKHRHPTRVGSDTDSDFTSDGYTTISTTDIDEHDDYLDSITTGDMSNTDRELALKSSRRHYNANNISNSSGDYTSMNPRNNMRLSMDTISDDDDDDDDILHPIATTETTANRHKQKEKKMKHTPPKSPFEMKWYGNAHKKGGNNRYRM